MTKRITLRLPGLIAIIHGRAPYTYMGTVTQISLLPDFHLSASRHEGSTLLAALHIEIRVGRPAIEVVWAGENEVVRHLGRIQIRFWSDVETITQLRAGLLA